MTSAHRDNLIRAGLTALTLAVYLQVAGFDFVRLDDPGYVSDNARVLSGLGGDNLRWAFTTTAQANWHPLTWLSLMLDAELGGGDPAWFHLTNLALHLINTLLLFQVFRGMTGASWRSGFVAMVFALHPQHVESVAWVAERKDVLSTLFWMLTMLAWARYARRPGPARYLPVPVLLTLGLMAKPMLVTLPLVLLLLDIWPLGRAAAAAGRHRVWDKLPLALPVLGSAIVTLWAQSAGGAVSTLERLPLASRLGNAVLAYAAYIGKLFWPSALALPYPYRPESITPGRVALAALLLVAVSAAVWLAARRRPWLAVGWAWFVVTLLPVIGIVQVGAQAMADRYSYVPTIGLSIMIAWGVPALFEARVRRAAVRRTTLAVLSAAVTLALGAASYVQVSHWRDTVTLFTHTLAVSPDNAVAHSLLGSALQDQGRLDEALAHHREAVRIAPGYVEARVNLGAALAAAGRPEEAVREYRAALRSRPGDRTALTNLGAALLQQGRLEEAEPWLRRALATAPEDVATQRRLGTVLALRGDAPGAVEHLGRVLRAEPDDVETLVTLGTVLMRSGDLEGAATRFERALRLAPDHVAAHKNLGVVRARQRRYEDAVEHFSAVLRLDPTDETAARNLERARELAAGTRP